MSAVLDLQTAKNRLECALSGQITTDVFSKDLLASVTSLNIEKVQHVFSILAKIVRPTTDIDGVDVSKILKKAKKRTESNITPIEIIAAMLLKNYGLLFYGGVCKNLNYWSFEAELLVKVEPMMLAKLNEDQDKLIPEYPEHVAHLASSDSNSYKYKLSEKKVIGSSTAHIYYAKKLKKCKALMNKTSKIYETIVILVSQTQTGLSPVFILASKGAWEDIRSLCSTSFSKNVSSSLASYCIKTDQVFTKQLIGPSASSDIQLRGPTAQDIDQRGILCHAFTVTFPPFEGIEGDMVRMKFFEEGVYIDQKTSLEGYEKFAKFLAGYDQYTQVDREATNQWGMPQLPNGLEQIGDETVVAELNTTTAAYLAGDLEKTASYDFDLEIARETRDRSSGFKVIVFDHLQDDVFYPLPFKGSTSELSIQKIKEAIHDYKGSSTLLHPPKRWIQHLLKGNITLKYKLDERHYQKPFLECLEGRVENPNGKVYFKSSGQWYQFRNTYYSELKTLTNQLQDNFLKTENEGFLDIEWDRRIIGEEAYSRLYLQREDRKNWFDGNRKQISNVEICDIMLSTQSYTYLYHLKKSGLVPGDSNMGASLRLIASQIIMSAQIIQSEINKVSELTGYCSKIKSSTENFTKKRIVFVLAIPFPSENPLETLKQSPSIIARREIVHLKSAVEKMGFIFKIAPITVSI